MNYQQPLPGSIQTLLNIFIEEKKMPVFSDYNYFAYPEMFASTATPCGGIGGSAMTTFTIQVYELNNGFTLYVCANGFILREEMFNPLERKPLSGWKKFLCLKGDYNVT